jgi:hypothetical protein
MTILQAVAKVTLLPLVKAVFFVARKAFVVKRFLAAKPRYTSEKVKLPVGTEINIDHTINSGHH